MCLSPWVNPPIALVLGLLFAQFIGHPFLKYNQKATTLLLQVSVVGLGFGMNLNQAMTASKEGILYTVISIIGTLILGILLGKYLKIDKKTSFLISSGTAICGGSAIAAVSPVIQAEEKQMTVALGSVFILNSVALLVFPLIGHALDLSQTQFGLWCAIAIHDTSSVVGAAGTYGTEALEIATTVKLARALWIIPLAFFAARVFKNNDVKVKIPYFIGYFILAIALNTYFEPIQKYGASFASIAKKGMTLTLFLIGSGLNRTALKSVGFKPFVQGIILWIVISLVSLWALVSL
jgi:uncharacterized integral membrane protein (TIGR00698 family)